MKFLKTAASRKREPPEERFDLIIEPNRTTADFLRELFSSRELLLFLAWRDLLVRYKQTVLGVGWSVIRPLISMVVFTIIFGRAAKLPSDGIPYPILVFSALLPWQFFSNAMQESANSLLRATNLIKKVYFPRLILPIASVLVSTVDFVISFLLLCLLMMGYRFLPSPRILLLPVFFLPAAMTALGFGFYFSSLGVKYRDFRYIVPFLLQVGLHVSPVGFSSSIVPERWRLIYRLNPMVGVIDGFRWCIHGTAGSLYLPGFLISIAAAVLVFFSGVSFFRHTERSFADFL